MRDIMIDLETLDTANTAAILSIAAVDFDIRTRKIGSSLYLGIGYENAMQSGGTVSQSTLDWWNEQDFGVKANQMHPSNPISHPIALTKLYNFIKGIEANAKYPIRVWANGPSFDIAILEYHYRKALIDIPWKHWSVRDVRTICDLGGVEKGHITFTGNKHDPIDDCIHQIKMVSRAHKRLKEKRS